MVTLKINAKDVKAIMDAIGSRKRHAYISAATDVTYSGTFWDGGSRGADPARRRDRQARYVLRQAEHAVDLRAPRRHAALPPRLHGTHVTRTPRKVKHTTPRLTIRKGTPCTCRDCGTPNCDPYYKGQCVACFYAPAGDT